MIDIAEIEPLHETDIILLEKLLGSRRYMLALISCLESLIRLYSSGRYHARLDVGDEYSQQTFEFRIRELASGTRELVSNFKSDDPYLTELVYHKAAEAMLAHRRGHRDAQLRKELRRPKTEQDD